MPLDSQATDIATNRAIAPGSNFYMVKLGFTWVYIFLIFALKHRLCLFVRIPLISPKYEICIVTKSSTLCLSRKSGFIVW